MTQPAPPCPLLALITPQPPAPPRGRLDVDHRDVAAMTRSLEEDQRDTRPAGIPSGRDAQPLRLLHRLQDAAELLSISRTKLYGLLRNDVIPSVLLGGTRMVAHADLVDFVDRLRTEAAPWAP